MKQITIVVKEIQFHVCWLPLRWKPPVMHCINDWFIQFLKHLLFPHQQSQLECGQRRAVEKINEKVINVLIFRTSAPLHWNERKSNHFSIFRARTQHKCSLAFEWMKKVIIVLISIAETKYKHSFAFEWMEKYSMFWFSEQGHSTSASLHLNEWKKLMFWFLEQGRSTSAFLHLL